MKIIEAINSMITNADKISSVIKHNIEYFFLFNGKYKWSISSANGEYYIFIYPKEDITIEQLASMTDFSESGYTDFITFKTEDLKTKEAQESFAELYQIVSSKVYGVDNILDDIISLDTP